MGERKGDSPIFVGRKSGQSPGESIPMPLDLVHNKAGRKAAGSYYTPEPIVRQIVEHTIGPLLDRKLAARRPAAVGQERSPGRSAGFPRARSGDGLRILPLGGGRFHHRTVAPRSLPSAARRVARPMLKRRVVERCLYGVDLDPLGRRIGQGQPVARHWPGRGKRGQPPFAGTARDQPAVGARLRTNGDCPLFQLDQHLRCGDALVGDTLDDLAGGAGFDVVIGNPPYRGVRTGTIDRALADYVTKRYTAARRNWDLAALFLERAWRWPRRSRRAASSCRRGSARTAISPRCGI